MTDQAKSREDLIKELKALRKEHDALKASFEKDLAERIRQKMRYVKMNDCYVNLRKLPAWVVMSGTSQTVYGQVQNSG